ncbi:probable DNA double-strand break repair Rad50 ATPase [Macrobrachium nipponense]|uniref:probable DNA double-strand break repair Rad50 ATPase n=1 Tax=Macrobrachium nipponense TaxID=159736 RepID=UPI0030C8A500
MCPEDLGIPEDDDDGDDVKADFVDEMTPNEDLDSKVEMYVEEKLASEDENFSQKTYEYVLWLEKADSEKSRMIEELREKIEALTEDTEKMERATRDLERLLEEKEIMINLMPAEMDILRKEIAAKTEETEKLRKENEDKNSTITILENTVVVLDMEKETLHRNLSKMEDDRNLSKVQLNKQNEDLQRLREEDRRKQKNIEVLQKENELRNIKMNGLENEIEECKLQKQRADENWQQLQQCKAELAERKEELEELKEQNVQKDREILRLGGECSQMQEDIICLLKMVKSVAAEKGKGKELNEMTRRKVQLEFELAEVKEEQETIEFEKMEAIVEIERLQEANVAKDHKIRSLEEQFRFLRMMPNEQPVLITTGEMMKSLDKPRCLRRPQVNCKALHRRLDSIEEGINQVRAMEQTSGGNKRETKALNKTPSSRNQNKQPTLNRDKLHQKMRLKSAANLQKLERDAAMVKSLYKINAVT